MAELQKQLVLDWTRVLLQNKALSFPSQLKMLCEKLQTEVAHFDWVGFYFANHKKKTLHLKAYAGAPTDHNTIPFGKGICGQVAIKNAPLNIPEVQAVDNYIACNVAVQSELVVPIIVEGVNVGQIDIDSHTPKAFSPEDERFLKQLCQEVALHYIPI